jgi:1-phosphofructokinase
VTAGAAQRPRVTVFGPHPLLTVTIERRGDEDDVHLHAGGQGVWASSMAGRLGAWPVLCGFAGGETGAIVTALLAREPGEPRLVISEAPTGCSVVDRRSGVRTLLAVRLSSAPSRHELDELVSATCAAALDSEVLLVCNPFPPDALAPEAYATLVSDVRANGTRVLVDLSTPRLDAALEGRPDLVKVNDWELAEYVAGPVDGPRMRPAAERLRAAGARAVLVTRGPEPALFLSDDGACELIAPRFDRGCREGCGDAMMGALAAGLATGRSWQDALVLGAAAGAANFLRHGVGTAAADVVEELAGRVEVRAVG